MKTYSGELKDGMPVRFTHTETIQKWDEKLFHVGVGIDEVYHDNEWKLYKPQAKKVWGMVESGEIYWILRQHETTGKWHERCHDTSCDVNFVYHTKEHAEQHAKALDMANEFRILSDVPVDGESQWFITAYGQIDSSSRNAVKLEYSIFGVVFNTKEQAEQALSKFPQIHIANRIIQFSFHGIVEERI